jgi:hypothetical protein
MKMATAAFCAAFAATGACQAGDLGIGVSVKSNDSAVYLPFKVAPHLMLEGRLEYQRDARSDEIPGVGPDTENATSCSLGAGCFGLSQLSESTRLYAGGRLSYVANRNEMNAPFGSSTIREHGWSVAPTVGVEYFPIKQLSVGAEVGLSYARLTGTLSSGGMDADTTRNHTSTESALIVRYYF